MKRVGIDVGGTFTDLMYVDEDQGQVVIHKLPSTPSDPAEATLLGLDAVCERAGVEPADLDHLFHGTTVATNIVLEHNGAKVGMLTTRGYRDILHIARHKRPLSFRPVPGRAVAAAPPGAATLSASDQRAGHCPGRRGAQPAQ